MQIGTYLWQRHISDNAPTNDDGDKLSPLLYSCQIPKKSESGLKGACGLRLAPRRTGSSSVCCRLYHITTCSPFRLAEELGKSCDNNTSGNTQERHHATKQKGE